MLQISYSTFCPRLFPFKEHTKETKTKFFIQAYGPRIIPGQLCGEYLPNPIRAKGLHLCGDGGIQIVSKTSRDQLSGKRLRSDASTRQLNFPSGHQTSNKSKQQGVLLKMLVGSLIYQHLPNYLWWHSNWNFEATQRNHTHSMQRYQKSVLQRGR